MILSSTLPFFPNTGKRTTLELFRSDYQQAVAFYVNYFWNNRIVIPRKNNLYYILDIKNQQFDAPSFISTTNIPIITDLSARALKCASTQALGIIKASIKALSKKQYIIKQHQKKNKDISKLQSTYDKEFFKLKVPYTGNVNPELNSICCNFETSTSSFDGYIILSSLGKKYGKLCIPINFTKHNNHLRSLGKQLKSFLITKKCIHFRYETKIDPKETGTTEGLDQGIKTCCTLSDGQITGKCIHGHDLDSIIKKLSKKKKGSKAFKKAQAHRTNYVNWSVKQLNLTSIKQIKLEEIRYMGKGQRRSRYLQGFTYKEIRTALMKNCYLAGVQLYEQSSPYRSQRCSDCGYVHKSNRNKKVFICLACKFTCDADLNASYNHKADLCGLVRNNCLPNKTEGFYWMPEGIWDVNGEVLTVPLAKKYKLV